MPPPQEDTIPPLKRQLAREIVALTEGWSQWNAACLLDLDQPRMSNLRRAKLECFSLDRLVRLLWRLDRRLEITLVDTGRRRDLLRRQRQNPAELRTRPAGRIVTLPKGSEEQAMDSKDPDKTQQKPVPVTPPKSSDIPEAVSDEDGKHIKGGPSGQPWTPKSHT